jgi:hypothetical protein
MSVKDLIAQWEEALVQALSPDERDELSERDLEMTTGVAIQSNVRAGQGSYTSLIGCTAYPGCNPYTSLIGCTAYLGCGQ